MSWHSGLAHHAFFPQVCLAMVDTASYGQHQGIEGRGWFQRQVNDEHLLAAAVAHMTVAFQGKARWPTRAQ